MDAARHYGGVSIMIGRILLGFVAQQAMSMAGAEMERHNKYNWAVEVAADLGKPVLVVAGPYGANPFRRIFGLQAHGCGDT